MSTYQHKGQVGHAPAGPAGATASNHGHAARGLAVVHDTFEPHVITPHHPERVASGDRLAESEDPTMLTRNRR